MKIVNAIRSNSKEFNDCKEIVAKLANKLNNVHPALINDANFIKLMKEWDKNLDSLSSEMAKKIDQTKLSKVLKDASVDISGSISNIKNILSRRGSKEVNTELSSIRYQIPTKFFTDSPEKGQPWFNLPCIKFIMPWYNKYEPPKNLIGSRYDIEDYLKNIFGSGYKCIGIDALQKLGNDDGPTWEVTTYISLIDKSKCLGLDRISYYTYSIYPRSFNGNSVDYETSFITIDLK